MEKSEFYVLIKHYFLREKPYQKSKPRSINIIQTLLHHMEWFRSRLLEHIMLHYWIDWSTKSWRNGYIWRKKKILFHNDNAPSHTSNIAQAKGMNWVLNRFHIHRNLQAWPPATIICSQTSRDGCVVGVLSRTKKLNEKQKGILKGLTNRIIWKA